MNIFKGATVGLIFLAFPLGASADFEAPPSNNWSATVDVSSSCTVNDTDGVAHTYSGGYYGICALRQAINDGDISSASLSNQFPAFGLFVTAINGTAAESSSQYWALYQNGSFAMVGITSMTVSQGDEVVIELHDFSDIYQGSRLTITVNSLVSDAPASDTTVSGGGIETVKPEFDVSKAIIFLRKHMTVDGALPNPVLTDWAAFAFASHNVGDGYAALREYQLTNHPSMQSVTDYERHAMALLALNIDPYSGTSVDYITPIVSAFDGLQFGDYALVNDDIFAIFPLLHAGYGKDDEMIQKAKTFIVSKQRPNGSWEDSVDLTAAALQALWLFGRTPELDVVLNKAELYLHDQQKDDGSFGNSFSTGWALQGIASIDAAHFTWTKSLYNTPRYYFATVQQSDGGVDPNTTEMHARIWTTAYAVPGIKGRTWDSLMSSFPRPVPKIDTSLAALATTNATTTEPSTEEPPASQPSIPSEVTDEPLDENETDARVTPTTTPEEALEQVAAAAASGGIDSYWLVLVILALIELGLIAYFVYLRYWR